MSEIALLTAFGAPDSPARTRPPQRAPFRIAAVQERWHRDGGEHERALASAIALAAAPPASA